MSRRLAKSVRRDLVRVAGGKQSQRAFAAGVISQMERGYIAMSRNMSRYLWGAAPAEPKTREVSVPRGLRKYIGRTIQVLW